MTEPIRLLHLSDFHFRTASTWDADPILGHLAEAVGTDVRARGLIPDLVVVTGDLAFAGHADEYEQAGQWLADALWPALTPAGAEPLPRDRLLLVPGNHDVDRARIGRGARGIQRDLLEERTEEGLQQTIAEVLGTEQDRALMLERHQAYLDFYGHWLGTPQPLPWWQRSILLHGQHLHIAGLDSAWMSAGDEDQGRLLIGRFQLNRSLDLAGGVGRFEEADGPRSGPHGASHWRLALMHHPWDYLPDLDRTAARQTVHRHCDLLLRGHLHAPDGHLVMPADAEHPCIELAAGCAYEHGSYPNAFQWVELHADPRRVQIGYRLWHRGRWIVDRNQGDAEGWRELRLGDIGPPPPLPPGPPSKPKIPTAYADWLRRRHADLDLLGKGMDQGRAIHLRDLYVPALTTAESEATGPDGAGAADPAGHRRAGLDPDAAERRPALLLARLDRESLYCPAAPGAGKTTFCRWALLKALGTEAAHAIPPPEGYAEAEPTGLRGRLPLLAPLRDLWPHLDLDGGRRDGGRADLEQALARWIARQRPAGLSADLLQAHLEAGSAFLLLDGLDEVPISEPAADGRTGYPRALLLSALAEALPGWRRAGNRLLCRPRRPPRARPGRARALARGTADPLRPAGAPR
jgi:hypothetical protein